MWDKTVQNSTCVIHDIAVCSRMFANVSFVCSSVNILGNSEPHDMRALYRPWCKFAQ